MRRTMILVMMLVAGVAGAQMTTRPDDAGALFQTVYAGGSTGSVDGGASMGMYASGGPKGRPGFGGMIDFGGVGSGLYRLPEGQFSVLGMTAYNLLPKTRILRRPVLLEANGGYSIYFVDGSALTYGGGVLWEYDREGGGYYGMKVEYRQSWFFGRGSVSSLRLSHEWGGGG